MKKIWKCEHCKKTIPNDDVIYVGPCGCSARAICPICRKTLKRVWKKEE